MPIQYLSREYESWNSINRDPYVGYVGRGHSSIFESEQETIIVPSEQEQVIQQSVTEWAIPYDLVIGW